MIKRAEQEFDDQDTYAVAGEKKRNERSTQCEIDRVREFEDDSPYVLF